MQRARPSGTVTQVMEYGTEPQVSVIPLVEKPPVDHFVGEGHRVGGPVEKKDNVLVLLGGLEEVGKVEDLTVRLACLETLDLVMGNISKQPNDPKFRTLNTSGKAFGKISGCPGGLDLLHKVGFKEDGSGHMVLPPSITISPAFIQVLTTLKGAALMEKGSLETAAAALAAKAAAEAAEEQAEKQRAANSAAAAAAAAAAANKERKEEAAAAYAAQQLAERTAKLKRAEQERAAQEQIKQEAAIKAIAEAAAASAAAAKLKLEQAQAQLAKERAEGERQRVEAERMRAEAQRERVEAAAREKAEKNRVRREEETRQQEAARAAVEARRAEAERVAEEKREAVRRAAEREMEEQRAVVAAAEQAKLNAERLALAARVGSNALWGAGKVAGGLVTLLGAAGGVLGKGLSLVAQGVAEATAADPGGSGPPGRGGPGDEEPEDEEPEDEGPNEPAQPARKQRTTRQAKPAQAKPVQVAPTPEPKIRAKNGPSVLRTMQAEGKTRKQVQNTHPEMYGFFKGNVSRPNVLGGAYTKKSKRRYSRRRN